MEKLSQNMRLLIRVVCGLLLTAAIGIVVWMAMEVGRDNVDTFRKWNPLYDYIAIGTIVITCGLIMLLAKTPNLGRRWTFTLLGLALIVGGVCGHFGFQLRSDAILEPIPPTRQLKPNAAETVLGYHYVCPESGGYVAFGDGSVKFVDSQTFATLTHADTPDQTPEFVSPTKQPVDNQATENNSDQQATNALSRARERMEHANNLKKMAVDHFHFQERDGIRVPLKPEHFKTYPGMSKELRNAITDGTYVWYFGWEPVVSYRAERARALWLQFASWASNYIAGLGAGLLLAGMILATKGSKQPPVAETGAE